MRHLRPAKRKSQARIAEPRGITSETSRHGEPSGHLAEGGHNEEDEETDDSVRHEDGAGAGLGKRLAGTDNETGADGATDGNHGNVSRAQATVQHRVRIRLNT